MLEQYFSLVSVRFLERIEAFSHTEPKAQIKSLADFWFRGETSTKSEIGFMLECFGAAVHDEMLKVTKADFDRRCKGYLTEIFRASPRARDHAKSSAEIAYSTMIGLRSAVYFDDEVDLDKAHALFHNMLLVMCEFD